MKKIVISLFITIVAAGTLAFAASEPSIVKSDHLQWQPANGLPGAEVAVVSGDPEKKGPFIARVKLPANFQIPVHTHHINEYDTVISGAWYLGTGAQFSANQAQKIPAGSFVMIPAKLQHYAFNKDETILQVNGMGPWGMVYKKNHKSC